MSAPLLVRALPGFVYEAAYNALGWLGYSTRHRARRWLFAIWFRAGTGNEWPDPWWSMRYGEDEPGGWWPDETGGRR